MTVSRDVGRRLIAGTATLLFLIALAFAPYTPSSRIIFGGRTVTAVLLMAWRRDADRIAAYTVGDLVAANKDLAKALAGLTDRLQLAEEEARRFRAMTDASPSGFITAKGDGTMLTWSRACERDYGWSATEAVGHKLEILLPEDLRERHRKTLEEAAARGYVPRARIALQSVGQHKDGHTFPAELFLDSYLVADQLFFVVIARDITPRQLIEEQMKRVYARFEGIFEHSHDAIMYFDADGLILHVNRACEQMIGYDRAEIVNIKTRWDITVPAYYGVDPAASRAVDTWRAESYNYLKQYIHKDGSLVDVEVTTFAVPTVAEDEGPGRVSVLRNLTEEGRKEDERRRLVEELKRSNAELDQFAYVAGHDLQEPLRMVTKFVGLLGEKYPECFDDKGRKYIQYAIDGAARMRTLIEDLLAYSRVTTKAKPLERFESRKVVDEVLVDLSERVAREDGRVVVVVGLPVIVADRSQFRQVIQNLVANGLKFHRQGVPPVVVVSSHDAPKDWEFMVKDNGIGMTQEGISKLFVMFTRLHNRDEYEGTGIGLAVCKKIVERHGGRIWIESEPGTGSTIHFTLPKREVTSDAGQPAADPPGRGQ